MVGEEIRVGWWVGEQRAGTRVPCTVGHCYHLTQDQDVWS